MSISVDKVNKSSPYLADNFPISEVLARLSSVFDKEKSICQEEALSVVKSAITIGSISNHRFFGSQKEISISAERIQIQPKSCLAAPIVLLTSGNELVIGTEGEERGLVSFYSPEIFFSAKTIRIGLNVEFLGTVKKATIFCSNLIVEDKPSTEEDPLLAIRPQLDGQLEQDLDPEYKS